MPAYFSPVVQVFAEYARLVPTNRHRDRVDRELNRRQGRQDREDLREQNNKLKEEVRELQEEAYFRQRSLKRWMFKEKLGTEDDIWK
ncbi:UNVERIFIED_CONTAM: hypothetical protein RMT77_005057 [Armadillidium vulgare]